MCVIYYERRMKINVTGFAAFELDLSVCLTPRQQGQQHRPVIVLTACVPVGWRRVMRVFHYGLDGWVRLADADRQQMCKVGGWFVQGSTASRRRWRAMPAGGKLRWGRLWVIVHDCHCKVKVGSNTVAEQTLITSANFSSTTQLYHVSLSLIFSTPALRNLSFSDPQHPLCPLGLFCPSSCLDVPVLPTPAAPKRSRGGGVRVGLAACHGAPARSTLSLNTSIDWPLFWEGHIIIH